MKITVVTEAATGFGFVAAPAVLHISRRNKMILDMAENLICKKKNGQQIVKLMLKRYGLTNFRQNFAPFPGDLADGLDQERWLRST
jgi:hypothetical protein